MTEQDLSGKTIEGYHVIKPIGGTLSQLYLGLIPGVTRAREVRNSIQSRDTRQTDCCTEKDKSTPRVVLSAGDYCVRYSR